MMKIYAPVRKAEDGQEWIDVSATSGDRAMVEKAITRTRAIIPGWDQENPVQRIGVFEMTEILERPSDGRILHVKV